MAVKVMKTFKANVRVASPGDPRGENATRLVAEYAVLSRTEREAFDATKPSDRQVLLRVLKGWEWKDNDGADIPFTPERLEQECAQDDLFEYGLVRAYVDAYNQARIASGLEKN